MWDRVDRFIVEYGVADRLESLTRENSGSAGLQSSGPAFSSRVRRGAHIITTGLLVCFLVTVVSWQVVAADLVDSPAAGGDDALSSTSWTFFAPDPPNSYSWYVIEADRESGELIYRVEQPVDADGPVGEPIPQTRATAVCV